MITLYQSRSGLGSIQLSSVCLKVETYLRMAGIEYVADSSTNVSKTPAKRVPSIVDGNEALYDSERIVNYLRSNYVDLDQDLNPEERAISHSILRISDQSLYYGVGVDRWHCGHDEILNFWLDGLLGSGIKATLLRPFVTNRLKASIGRIVGHYSGYGSYPASVNLAMSVADLECLSTLLGDKPYFLGDEPHSCDAAAFGQLDNLIPVTYPSDLKTAAARFENLTAYHARIRSRWFAEF